MNKVKNIIYLILDLKKVVLKLLILLLYWQE